MRIYQFSNSADRESLQELFISHFKGKNLVPFLGSGFSVGLKALSGRVPSVDELKGEMVELMAQMGNYSKDDIAELKEEKLSALSELFWPQIDDPAASSIKGEFETYLSDNFTRVSDISEPKNRFLNSEWRYIYTLNYDDAIERATGSRYISIFPYEDQSLWTGRQQRIIKLHGDALKYASTGDKRFCILSPNQYINALTDAQNNSMIDNLRTDFASNNILFIGCSLTDEFDMLFSASFRLAEEKKSNSSTRCYYVRYLRDGDKPLSIVQKGKYENYAITDIIEVTSSEMEDFYAFVAKASESAKQLRSSDNLSPYTGLSFSWIDPTDREKNLKYLYYSNEILPDDSQQVMLPSFFVRRDVTKMAIKDLYEERAHFYVFRGNRLSGKTYVLLDIAREFRTKNTYFFPSRSIISDDCLKKLLCKKNSILVFDEHAISGSQINGLLTESKQLQIKRNNVTVIVAVDRSMGMFTKHYYEQHPENSTFVSIYDISQRFSSNELTIFNESIGNYGVSDRLQDETFLDYMFSIGDEAINKHRNLLPPINVIDNNNTLKILILLAHQETLYLSQGARLRLVPELIRLQAKASTALQLDYLTEMELSHLCHDSQRYVSNSQYWVYKCLANYAHTKSHYENIAQAYYDIVSSFQRLYGMGTKYQRAKKYRDAVKPYYFLDTIQFTFFQLSEDGGSLSLANLIYEKLQPLFKNEYQFLHQKAKCLLWTSRRKGKDESERAELLEQAGILIKRAQQAANRARPGNLEYTIFHMDMTRALIMTNNWRYCRSQLDDDAKGEYLSKLIVQFFELVSSDGFSQDSNDELDRREMEDFKWLVTYLLSKDAGKIMFNSDKLVVQQIFRYTKDSGLFSF